MSTSPSRMRTVLDRDFGSGSPASWWLALLLQMPNSEHLGAAEVPFSLGYARLQVTNSVANFPAAATVDGITRKQNGAAFTWPNPTGTWGLCIGWAAHLTSTGGTPEFANRFDNPITVKSGLSPVQIGVGELYLTVANAA